MLLVSNLQKFELIDGHGKNARLFDLAIGSLENDYPSVTTIFYRNDEGKIAGLNWTQIKELKAKERKILIEDLSGGIVFDEQRLDTEVLLVRDVLDAIVLDLQNRRATRANDLSLELTEDGLMLRGVDVSARAIFRRVFGTAQKPKEDDVYDWKYIEFLRGYPHAARNGAAYRSRITRLAPGEIAGLLESIPYLHAAELIVLLPDEIAADVLEITSPRKQLQIIEELEQTDSIKLLTLLAPESTANIIKMLEPAMAKQILERVEKKRSQQIIDLLRYPEGTVGSIMTNDVLWVPSNLTVEETRNYLSEPISKPNFVYFIYTVEDEKSRRLDGVLSLRKIIMAEPQQKLSEIKDSFVSFLHPLDDAKNASFRVIDSHLAAMPVVDNEGKLLGALTIDAAVSTVAPAAWRDIAPRVFS